MRTIIALLAALLCLPAYAAGEAFIHKGWKGYIVSPTEMGGCRMTKRITRSLHALAHVTGDGNFLIGFVDTAMSVPPGTTFEGFARFDGVPVSLSGSSDNNKVVTFGSSYPRLQELFSASHQMRMEWSAGRGWIVMPLTGSRRAAELLRACAIRSVRPRDDYVTSYAPRDRGASDRMIFDTDLRGRDYLWFDRGSLNQCISACRDEPICRAVTYNETKGRCFLKHSVGRIMPFQGATSWVK